MVNVVLRCANAKSQTQKNCPTLQVPEDERLARLQLNADRGDRHVVTRLGLEFLLMRVAVAVVAMLALPMVVVALRVILVVVLVVMVVLVVALPMVVVALRVILVVLVLVVMGLVLVVMVLVFVVMVLVVIMRVFFVVIMRVFFVVMVVFVIMVMVLVLTLPVVVVAFRMILMIMMVVVVFFEEFGVEIQRFFERKTIDVDQILRIHLSVLALEMVGELGNSKQCCRHVCIKRNPAGGHDCMIWLQSPGTTA